MDFIQFTPIYKQRPWGGNSIATILSREINQDTVGESWEIVDRPNDQSIIANGENKEMSLDQLLKKEKDSIMGPNWNSRKRFPILVKWLDCRETLSLQVHPPENLANELNGEPKTENWYIVQAEHNASLMAGLKKGVDHESFKNALQNETVENCLHNIPVKTGDSLFIPSGRLHAIGAGNFILEIQQNSDTTYRVYDWNRVGLDGQKRQLHITESLKCIHFNDIEPSVIHESSAPKTILVDSPIFKLDRYQLNKDTELHFTANEEPRIISVIEGDILINEKKVLFGTNVLLPYAASFFIKTSTPSAKILVTHGFAS